MHAAPYLIEGAGGQGRGGEGRVVLCLIVVIRTRTITVHLEALGRVFAGCAEWLGGGAWGALGGGLSGILKGL